MMKRLFPIFAVLSLLCSCRQQVQVGPQPVSFVREAIQERSGKTLSIVKGYQSESSAGAVCIIGSPLRSAALLDRFATCDDHDNVDGTLKHDALPDFSGEILTAILDAANAPYQGYLDEGNGEYLRELTVKHVLSALDTTCYISPFDRTGLGRKSTSKVIVLSSPYMSAFGKFDVDTLFKAAGKEAPIVCPVDVVFEDIFSSHDGPVNLGVVSTEGETGAEAYSDVFRRIAEENRRTGCNCIVFPADTTADQLVSFIDRYMAAGYTQPLDAIVVDDFEVDIEAMKESFARVTSVMSEESLTYSGIFSGNFRIYDTVTAATSECYKLLRGRNIFTHNISYPRKDAYLTVPDPDFNSGDRYSRAAGSDISTYMLIPYSPRYFSDEKVEAYVQDQR